MSDVIDGFVLTRQWRDADRGLTLVFWLASPRGPVKFEVVGGEAVCFVDAAERSQVQHLLPAGVARLETTALRSFAGTGALALRCPSRRALLDCGDRLRRAGLAVLEADVKPTDRFLMERFITGAMRLEGELRQRQGYLDIAARRLEPSAYRPRLRSLSIDIETNLEASELYSIALFGPGVAEVIMRAATTGAGEPSPAGNPPQDEEPRLGQRPAGEGKPNSAHNPPQDEEPRLGQRPAGEGKPSPAHNPPQDEGPRLGQRPVGEGEPEPAGNLRLCRVADERTLLATFLARLRELDPDVIVGWNVVHFDLRALQRFCDRLKLDFTLGRGGETPHWRPARDNPDRFHLVVPGRVVLDGIELLRTASYHFENYSLEHVAGKLLGRGKLVTDADRRGEEITRLFHHDQQALARYNLEDCRLVWDIFTQEKLWEFAIERAQLTGLALDRYGGSVAAFDYLYLPRLHRRGFVAPAVTRDTGENSHGAPGGYVMSSRPGIHDNVIVLDFKSLYPSIIRTFHIDPLALARSRAGGAVIPGFDGAEFARDDAILPELIAELWRARDRAKAAGDSALSQAIKIIMNSFYGVLGTRGCRFHDHRLVSSITKRGHEIIKATRDEIERRGMAVIYGDTDSVFVLLDQAPASEVAALGRHLATELNEWWRQRVSRDFGTECFLELQFETHFLRFLMPTVRSRETGSKKRYAGLVSGADGEPRLLFKGLETVRSDWSDLARQFQRQLYWKVFHDEPVADYIKGVVADLQDGRFEEELLLRKRLRRKLADYVKNIPPHVQAARRAEDARKDRNLPSRYQRGGHIEYYMTVNGAEPRQYRSSPIDYGFYLDRQLAPIADSILGFQSTSLAQIIDRQGKLF